MKHERLFVLILILFAAFVRLYRFDTFLEFLGDQGRDSIIAKQILIDHNFTLLGPGTSVGKMYLGPLYYYVMVPFLALTYPQPTGPAYAVALLSILTVYLVYRLGIEMVGRRAAAIAAILYTVSPIIIRLSRFSWQPNPAPFFGLLMMWFGWKALTQRKPWLWVWVAVCFAVLSQLHYVALLSIVPSGIFFLDHLFKAWKERKDKKHKHEMWQLFGALGLGVVVLCISISPLVLFDFRHNHLIVEGFRDFSQQQSRENWTFLQRIFLMFVDSHGVGMRLTAELAGLPNAWQLFNTLVFFSMFALGIWSIHTDKKYSVHRIGVTTIFIWLMITILGLSALRNTVYEHYFAFVFPISMLAMGVALSTAMKMLKIPFVVGMIALCLPLSLLVKNYPYWGTAPVGIHQLKDSADKILPYIEQGEIYNIASLNEQKEYTGFRYRYFLEVSSKPPRDQYSYDSLDKLVVIVENKEDPTKSPIFEIQHFLKGGPAELQQVISLYDEAKAYVFVRE